MENETEDTTDLEDLIDVDVFDALNRWALAIGDIHNATDAAEAWSKYAAFALAVELASS